VNTLPTLISIARTKPVAKELACPTCGGDIELEAGLLWCRNQRHVFERLAELAVKGEERSAEE